jgi:ABC-2 type transport system ATP-binding protein
MLEARLLTKRYAGVPVVDHVSFSIEPGEILGYVGPNGAGKSTTVKMLTGLIEPASGHIYFHGREVRDGLKAYQRRIGYVPEEPHLYPHLSGREYLQLAGRLHGSHVLEVVEKVCDRVLIPRKGQVAAHDSVARQILDVVAE